LISPEASWQRSSGLPKPQARRVSLSEFGVSFEDNKQQLEISINQGRNPLFGYPTVTFGELKTAFDGLFHQDASKLSEDSALFKINQEQFNYLTDVLVHGNYAEKAGKQLLIKQELDEMELPKKYWLYTFLHNFKPEEIKRFVTDYDSAKRAARIGNKKLSDSKPVEELIKTPPRSPMHSRKHSCKCQIVNRCQFYLHPSQVKVIICVSNSRQQTIREGWWPGQQ